jgi:hypothetical protein
VFVRLGRPSGIRCDAVEADQQFLQEILPMPEELQLLTHVRQVNVDDRELAAGDSDGYFAVVMSNRIPRSGADYVCCLVSVEERTDLLPVTDYVDGGFDIFQDAAIAEISEVTALSKSSLGTSMTAAEADKLAKFSPAPAAAATSTGIITPATSPKIVGKQVLSNQQFVVQADVVLHPKSQLVLLHSWTFTCEGDGTFRQLMQSLDVGMIGDVEPPSKLAVTDTGHIKIDVIDRLGAPEQSWYRGPFVAQPLTRDALGPYHSADQARRVVAETGAENISYAAAFEAGRLLAAADARLAQDLMRWRRGSFRSSARQSAIDLLQVAMRLNLIQDPLDPVALRYSVDVLEKMTKGIAPPTDRYGVEALLNSPLLQPELVAKAFALRSVDDAVRLLGADVALTQSVLVDGGRAAPTTNLDQVLSDTAGIAALAQLRQRAISNLQEPGGDVR